jgi:hypothetical protein
MDASDRISFQDCPTCGRPQAVGWTEADLTETNCLDGCHLALWPASQRPTFGAGPDGDAIARREVVVVLFEQAIHDTAATYGLTDLRTAASLVADAWADVLHEEGRSPRLVESAAAAVRKVGDGMHRRQK